MQTLTKALKRLYVIGLQMTAKDKKSTMKDNKKLQ